MGTTEDYVSFETAKLLKEKGFDWEEAYTYSDKGELFRLSDFGIRDLTNKDCDGYSKWQFPIEGVDSIVSAPTLQMAMKWLREVHKIHIVIGYTFKADANLTKEYVSYCYQAENANTSISYVENVWYDTYEEACEASIKYCLENLV